MISRILKKLLKAFCYFMIFGLIFQYFPLLYIPISLYLIFKLYKNDFFTKFLIKYKIKKEYKNIKFINKINLYENFKEYNEENFDKNIYEYKKHFICLSKNKVSIIGYNSIKNELYKKDFEINNIEEIYFENSTDVYTYTTFDTKTYYRTITTQYNSYTETVNERTPTTAKGYRKDFGYVNIIFQDIEENGIMFDFGRHKDRYTIPIKFRRICRRIGIKNISKIQL